MNEEKYKKGEKCMCFSNDEIKKYLLDKIDIIDELEIILLSDIGKVIEPTSNKKISTVVFDGAKEEFFISFYDDQTSLFFADQQIMFIDDNIKNNYTISDTYSNIVYEGTLRDKDHEEMLSLFSELIILLSGYVDIKVDFIPVVEKNRPLYDYFDNTIYIYGKNSTYKEYVFENLTFKFL